MATKFLGLSVAPEGRSKLFSRQINTTGLKTGAALVVDTSVAGSMVKAPAGAAALGFAGLLATEYRTDQASVAGEDCEIQRADVGRGILASGASVTYGQELVIAGTDGSLRPVVIGTDDDACIVGTSEITLSTVSVNTPIPVNLDRQSSLHRGT